MILVLTLAVIPGPATAEQLGLLTVLKGVSGTRNGLTLQRSRVQDIQSVLGPTMVIKDDLTSDISRMCYVSTLDYSLIAFEIKHQSVTRIRVMKDKHRYARWIWCTATPLTADDLALANGIALGFQPVDVENILGTPHNLEQDKWVYRFIPATPDHLENLKSPGNRHGRGVWMAIEFTNSRLVDFDIRLPPAK